ncbi:MAG: hypothetical protein AAF550_07430 [Myxococcota bacterium]
MKNQKPKKRRVSTCSSAMLLGSLLLTTAALTIPALGQLDGAQTRDDAFEADEEPELPSHTVVINVDAEERTRIRIGIPNFMGPSHLTGPAAEVARNDLTLISLFEVLPARQYPSADAEGLAIRIGPWAEMETQAVIKGSISGTESQQTLELHLFEISAGPRPTWTRTYRGTPGELRGFVHDFCNKVVEKLTGEAAHFHTRVAYASRLGPGRKDVRVADYDGFNDRRVSTSAIAMLPSFAPSGEIWYSVLTQVGMFITRAGARDAPVIEGDGLTMSPTICEGRVFFTSTRHGNSELYSSRLDGSRVRRLTRHPAIDVSPRCGPRGKLAFVSARHGKPQIFTMDYDGSNVERVTFRGDHNQTPAWCPDPSKPLLAFTGRQGGLDIFIVNTVTQDYLRLTQGQGENKDPAWSPDCRMLAFSSSRDGGGLYIMNPRGYNQTRILSGSAETVSWSP